MQVKQMPSLKPGGRKPLVISEVTPIATSSLNSGDVYLLDRGNDILQWNGKASAGIERAEAAAWASRLIESRGVGHVQVFGPCRVLQCSPRLRQPSPRR